MNNVNPCKPSVRLYARDARLVGIAAVAGFFTLPHLAHDDAAPESAAAGATVRCPSWRRNRRSSASSAPSPSTSPSAIASRTRRSRLVSPAYQAGAQHSVDPLLILAVMAVESRYNPVAESSMGARGLMQVIPKYHLEKLLDHGGEPALLDPAVNIVVGAQILREYQRRFRDTETALQMYAGALDDAATLYAERCSPRSAPGDALR